MCRARLPALVLLRLQLSGTVSRGLLLRASHFHKYLGRRKPKAEAQPKGTKQHVSSRPFRKGLHFFSLFFLFYFRSVGQSVGVYHRHALGCLWENSAALGPRDHTTLVNLNDFGLTERTVERSVLVEQWTNDGAVPMTAQWKQLWDDTCVRGAARCGAVRCMCAHLACAPCVRT